MDTTEITHISLCSGYGGIDLGLRRVLSSLRTVAYAEIEAFACENLLARMEGGQLDAAPIWSDLKSFPWESFRGVVDILSGGYPCQPFSAAGKRAGADDPRHLWPFISAGIAAMRPTICFFENVEGHISLGLPDVIEDLSGMWVYESCGNPSQGQKPIEQFKRELGYALCQLSYEIALERGKEAVEGAAILQGLREASEGAWALSDALPEMEEVWRSALDQKVWEKGCYVEAASQGNRTDELRLLGNGVVPATAELAFKTLINEIQKTTTTAC